MAMPRLVPRLLKGPFTVDDYYRMAETGVLPPDARVELLDGQVALMSPIGLGHASCVNRLTAMLVKAVGERATVTVQNPVRLDLRSEPQPDIALVEYRADGYASRHPGPADVLLLIEVADTTLDKDHGVKLPLYARSGIPEVWIVNLEDDVIEIYTTPGVDGYQTARTAVRGDTLRPNLLPALALSATDILS